MVGICGRAGRQGRGRQAGGGGRLCQCIVEERRSAGGCSAAGAGWLNCLPGCKQHATPGGRAGGGTHQDIAGVAVAQREAGVGDQVRQALVAAQQALLRVVVEAALGLLDGGLQRQGGRGAGLVLQAGTRRGAGREGWGGLVRAGREELGAAAACAVPAAAAGWFGRARCCTSSLLRSRRAENSAASSNGARPAGVVGCQLGGACWRAGCPLLAALTLFRRLVRVLTCGADKAGGRGRGVSDLLTAARAAEVEPPPTTYRWRRHREPLVQPAANPKPAPFRPPRPPLHQRTSFFLSLAKALLSEQGVRPATSA